MSVITSHHQIIRKLIVGFGNIFDNITMVRHNPDDTENKRIKVPIIYSPKERYVTRLLGDPNLDKKVQITLPRMSFDLTGMEYDASRKQITNQKITASSGNGNTRLAQYNPVPYNFHFSLYLYVRNIEDGTQIIEHILPFFTPEYNINLNLVPSMGVTKSIPIALNKVDYNIDYEGNEDSGTRIVIWTLDFTAKAFIYGAVTEAAVIKRAFVNILNGYDLSDVDTATFSMEPSGFGKYKEGETVFQGYSLGTATAVADVISYSSLNNELIVTNIKGNFTSNTIVYGFDSFSEFNLENFTVSNNKIITIETFVNPESANVNSEFIIETNITEYPIIFNPPRFSNTIIDFSSTEFTMDMG